MNIFVRPEIKQMKDINWGDVSDKYVRLLWGENPIVNKTCMKAVVKEVNKLNLYPSATKSLLREKIALYCGVGPQNIVITNGSDEALELIAKVFIEKSDEVIIPEPSYPCFESVSQMMGAKIIKVSLNSNFTLDTNNILSKISKKTKIVWIANPNNPTGNILISQSKLETFIKQVPCLVVFDECYFEFARVSAAALIAKYPNAISTRSFSKAFGFGGLRLGYLIANDRIAKYINRLVQNNQVFNVNRFALVAGETLFKDRKKMDKQISAFEALKATFEEKLSRVKGIAVVSTKTSFCLIKIVKAGVAAAEIKRRLEKKDIYIKDCSIYPGLGKSFFYVGVPPIKQQRKVLQAIRSVVR